MRLLSHIQITQDERAELFGIGVKKELVIQMKTRIAAIATAFALGAASISSAMAFERPTRYSSFNAYDVEATGSLGLRDGNAGRNPATCPMSSAAEGNANQQNFPVQQYGQTSGGNRC